MTKPRRLGRTAPFRLTPPTVPEHALQRAIADALTIEIAPAGKVSKHGVVWYAVDHANYAGEVPGIRVGRGIIAGVPDTFVMHKGRAHFIEVKRDDGSVSDAQKSVATALLVGGGLVGIARGVAEVLNLLDAWEIPRNRRIRLEHLAS